MRQVLMRDIDKRLKGLSKSSSNVFSEKTTNFPTYVRPADIKRYIESEGRSDSIRSFGYIVELFEVLSNSDSVSEITKMGRYISENVVHKVRDAKNAQKTLKGRLTRWQNKLKVQSPKPKTQQNREKAVTEAYERMLEAAIIYDNCDRVLENYNNISKRFNLELLMVENTKVNGIYDTVVELCNRIDTYSMPDTVKFNTVLETALYGFESNHIPYTKSEIIKAAIDYFAFKENGLNSCKQILDASLFFDKNDDMSDIDIFTEDEPEENSIDSSIRSAIVGSADSLVTESSEFKELFENFKKEELAKEDGKPEAKLKSLVTKLYAKNVDDIVQGTPSLLSWIRTFFIVGSCAIPIIGPVLMVVGFIADRFIALHMDAEETAKMITCFNSEIKKSKAKLESITNSDDKERLNKYIKSLEEARDKIRMYHNDIYDGDVEYDDCELGGDDFDFGDDFDIDFDDMDDLDISLSEMVSHIQRSMNANNSTYVSELLMWELPSKLTEADLPLVSSIINHFGEALYRESYISGLRDEICSVKKNKTLSTINRAIRVHTLENCIKSMTTPENREKYNIRTVVNETASIAEFLEAINIIYSTNMDDYVLEASFLNSLRLASMKIKNSIQKMSDKERAMSKTVDVSVNNLSKSAERAMSNDNREAIIKGSVLPSASKIIKLGITAAGVAFLGGPSGPVIAAIGVLGYLACSAKFKNKERQAIIDEIEIELKMCKQYMAIAEQKNDMKALKQLMMTERELTRQLQRVKYKMRVDLGKKYYDPKHVGDK